MVGGWYGLNETGEAWAWGQRDSKRGIGSRRNRRATKCCVKRTGREESVVREAMVSKSAAGRAGAGKTEVRPQVHPIAPTPGAIQTVGQHTPCSARFAATLRSLDTT